MRWAGCVIFSNVLWLNLTVECSKRSRVQKQNGRPDTAVPQRRRQCKSKLATTQTKNPSGRSSRVASWMDALLLEKREKKEQQQLELQFAEINTGEIMLQRWRRSRFQFSTQVIDSYPRSPDPLHLLPSQQGWRAWYCKRDFVKYAAIQIEAFFMIFESDNHLAHIHWEDCQCSIILILVFC